MTTTFRAALSLLLLAGFYVVALAMIAGLGLLSAFAFRSGAGTGGAKLAFVALAAGIAVVAALVQVARSRPQPEPGLQVSRANAPALWAELDQLAVVAQTRVPDEIRLVPDVNAAVSEDARLLGLVPGRRRLYLGVPLVQALDVSQLRSVLAHELGHYSRSHTRLGPLTYRGRVAIGATLDALSGNIVVWALKGYARLYLLVSASVSRRQELEADDLSVRVAGRSVAQGTLKELPLVDRAWSFYGGSYLDAGWENGLAPTAAGFFGGFGSLLAARGDELATMRQDAPPAEQSRWDSHPSIAARVAAMEGMPDVAVVRDTRPATSLVPGFENAAAALAEQVVAFGDRVRLDWDAFTAASVAQAQQRTADTVYRAVARLTGRPRATLATVLDVVGAGRLDEVVRSLGLDPAQGPDEDGDTPAGLVLGVVVRSAAVQAGIGRWQHSWGGPAVLVRADGQPLVLDDVVASLADPGGAHAARAALQALGIDVERAGQVSEVATAHGGDVVGGLATVDVDGKPAEVLVLDNGLVIVPSTKDTEGGKERLAMLAGVSAVELARRYRFVAFEDVATAEVLKRTPVKATFTLHDGTTLTLKERWSGDRLTKDSDEVLIGAAESLAGQAVPVR
ncbi:M48 family metallopeptidase [Cellulomonas sp. URHB0016]